MRKGAAVRFLLMGLVVAVVAFNNPPNTSFRKNIRPTQTFLLGRSNRRGVPRRKPGELPWEYQRRLNEALADPSRLENKKGAGRNGTTTDPNLVVVKGSGYQRIEEWDEQKRRTMTTKINWEERVQMDGLRHGNHLEQNEILRRNLSK